MFEPNGLCFSPDYKKVYVADTGATHYDKAPRNIMVFDVEDGKKVKNGRQYVSMEMEVKGKKKAGLADGIRADTDGNIWVGADWVGDGYDGVHIFAPRRCPHRPDSSSRHLRQPLLRRPQAQPPVHVRQPVSVRGLR
jgi:gluconolactonase